MTRTTGSNQPSERANRCSRFDANDARAVLGVAADATEQDPHAACGVSKGRHKRLENDASAKRLKIHDLRYRQL